MSHDEILAYEDRRFAAMASGDLEALAPLLAEDLHYVHANGMIEDKREFLRKLSSGERRYLAFRAVERTCRRDGDFTFVFGEAEVEVDRAAGRLSNRLTYTAIYRHRPEPSFLAWHAVKSLRA
jgi:ketosteroid isomerase-like protein